MSVVNTKGFPFAILTEKGCYELFDSSGKKLDIPMFTIRITQSVDEVDKMVVIAPVNVVTKEQMQNLITEWQTK